MTYKQLVLDLLCKKISPLIITGLIINHAHKCQSTCKETFLATIIRKQNSQAFIKCFTDKAVQAKRGGQRRMEQLMRALHTDKLILLPRISQAARNSLDHQPDLLQVSELTVRFTPVMKQMHALLIQIMQSCLDEILRQYNWQIGKLDKLRQQEFKNSSAFRTGPAALQVQSNSH